MPTIFPKPRCLDKTLTKFVLKAKMRGLCAGGGGGRSPEAAVIKQKMIYTSSKDYLKKALVGVGKEIQACDYGDLDWSTVLETLLRTEVAQ